MFPNPLTTLSLAVAALAGGVSTLAAAVVENSPSEVRLQLIANLATLAVLILKFYNDQKSKAKLAVDLEAANRRIAQQNEESHRRTLEDNNRILREMQATVSAAKAEVNKKVEDEVGFNTEVNRKALDAANGGRLGTDAVEKVAKAMAEASAENPVHVVVDKPQGA